MLKAMFLGFQSSPSFSAPQLSPHLLQSFSLLSSLSSSKPLSPVSAVEVSMGLGRSSCSGTAAATQPAVGCLAWRC